MKEEEEEKINYDAKETCILIEYLMDNSQYPIPKEGGKFGRHIDNDIVLYDKDVSRKHAEIFYLDNKFWLKDLKSSIGTLIQIKEPIILENMIKIEIGNIYKITLEKISKKKLKIRIANEDDENEKVQEIDFGSNSKKIKIFLGQAQNCQIKLISKKKIEDYHCKIYINDDEEMVLEDLNSEIGYLFIIINIIIIVYYKI